MALDSESVAAMRHNYQLAGLHESDLAADPVRQFARWLADAVAAELAEPNAMVLATADESGRPSIRTVLLKGYDAEAFIFYTNYGSRKAGELAANPYAALLFPWHALGRQVVIEGTVSKVSPDRSARYFRSRPHSSQIGAWASRQSSVIPSREALDARYAELAARWPEGTDVPVPPFWGGYQVRPERVEFWQGRPGRLHDRLRYRRVAGDTGTTWTIERLAP